jgi:hypothetical protein
MKRIHMSILAMIVAAQVPAWGQRFAAIATPSEYENVEGNTFSSALSRAPLRYQQVYDASEFGQVADAGGGWVENIFFRLDSFMGRPFRATFSSIQITFSTTPFGPDALSPVFSENTGSDAVVVFDAKPLELGAGFTPTMPQPWTLVPAIVFDTPFFYDPRLGNLLIDIESTYSITESFPPFDAVNTLGDSVSSVWAINNPGATSGTVETLGFVNLITVELVPEPSTWALGGVAAAFAAVIGWRKRFGRAG